MHSQLPRFLVLNAVCTCLASSKLRIRPAPRVQTTREIVYQLQVVFILSVAVRLELVTVFHHVDYCLGSYVSKI